MLRWKIFNGRRNISVPLPSLLHPIDVAVLKQLLDWLLILCWCILFREMHTGKLCIHLMLCWNLLFAGFEKYSCPAWGRATLLNSGTLNQEHWEASPSQHSKKTRLFQSRWTSELLFSCIYLFLGQPVRGVYRRCLLY